MMVVCKLTKLLPIGNGYEREREKQTKTKRKHLNETHTHTHTQKKSKCIKSIRLINITKQKLRN